MIHESNDIVWYIFSGGFDTDRFIQCDEDCIITLSRLKSYPIHYDSITHMYLIPNHRLFLIDKHSTSFNMLISFTPWLSSGMSFSSSLT